VSLNFVKKIIQEHSGTRDTCSRSWGQIFKSQ